jgi:DNA ligase-1
MLAKTIEKVQQDPKGWLMSEKLDGVRCFWNGKKLYSRNGNEFYAPKWFTDELPTNIALDGELFTKRSDFQNIIGIVKSYDNSTHTKGSWSDITYMVFDAPLLAFKFSKRLEIIEVELKTKNQKIVQLHKHEKCKN